MENGMIVRPAMVQDVKRISCPSCKEKIHGVGLTRGAKVDGLTFKCRRCGRFWEVQQEKSGEHDALRKEGITACAAG